MHFKLVVARAYVGDKKPARAVLRFFVASERDPKTDTSAKSSSVSRFRRSSIAPRRPISLCS